MFTRRSLRLVLVCVLTLSLLTGCVTTLAPVRPLLAGNSDSSAYNVAVAVQANGIKHYAWNECRVGGCRLVYQRIRFGAPIYQYILAEGSSFDIRYHDLAVTADGRAFVVHSLCNNGCVDYYSIVPADADDNTPIDSEPLATPSGNSAGPPKLEARDN
ncbi:MAG TPA: hypothetical protein VGD58_26845, partial [Herpetosiphonaceae bacterium]